MNALVVDGPTRCDLQDDDMTLTRRTLLAAAFAAAAPPVALDAARRDDPALVTTDTSALFKLEAPARALLVGHQLTQLRAELGVDSLTIDFGSAWRVVDRLRYTLAAIAIEPAANDGAGVSV